MTEQPHCLCDSIHIGTWPIGALHSSLEAMQHGALRRMYESTLAKAKHAAVVSPVLDEYKEEDGYEEGEDRMMARPEYGAPKSRETDWRAKAPFEISHGDDFEQAPDTILQIKSSLRSPSPRFFSRGGSDSNQDSEEAARKYAVVGQKQQWRKSRAQRHPHMQTITPVDGEKEERDEHEELGERASSYLSSYESVDCQSDVVTSAPLYLDRLPSARSSRESDSSNDSFSARSYDQQNVFVVTRQRKSKYAARLYLAGQNPLYLGRYSSEEAARAACERAFSTITTPRK